MKILVYGSGVLGSYLAHVLYRGGNDVTMLARGERLKELAEKGLIIRHYIQRKTTIDRVKITDRFEKNDFYDIVFVVMQRTQLDEVLPILCENEGCGLYILVGNNPTADETQRYIEVHSNTPKKVVFGFQSSGGRREKGKVISVYFGTSKLAGTMTAGSLGKDDSFKPLLAQAFSKTRYRIRYHENMDAWLKCHLAFIMPIAFACYYTSGNLRKIAGNKEMLNRIIDAMDEAYRILEACGYPKEAKEDADFVRNHRLQCYWMLKLMAATPIGRLAACDHAMAAKGEMRRLFEDYCKLKDRASISTPAWDELAKYMIG